MRLWWCLLLAVGCDDGGGGTPAGDGGSDAQGVDGGRVDAQPTDVGRPDTGRPDAAGQDARPVDAAPPPDAAPADAAPADAQATDAALLPDACRPDCDRKICGPDGCGGTCGECGAEEACEAGRCVAMGCGDAFECDGECVDLLSDPRYCGACTTDCADRWPDALTQAGIEQAEADAVPLCIEAECAVGCAGVDGPVDLLANASHCGACGAACPRVGLIQNNLPRCADGACRCFVGLAGAAQRGTVCQETCMASGDLLASAAGRDVRLNWRMVNCPGGCCPIRNFDGTLIAEQVPARSFHGYLLRLAQPIRTSASVNGPNQESDLLAFEVRPDGRWAQLQDENPSRTGLTAAFPAGLVLVIGGSGSIGIEGAAP